MWRWTPPCHPVPTPRMCRRGGAPSQCAGRTTVVGAHGPEGQRAENGGLQRGCWTVTVSLPSSALSATTCQCWCCRVTSGCPICRRRDGPVEPAILITGERLFACWAALMRVHLCPPVRRRARRRLKCGLSRRAMFWNSTARSITVWSWAMAPARLLIDYLVSGSTLALEGTPVDWQGQPDLTFQGAGSHAVHNSGLGNRTLIAAAATVGHQRPLPGTNRPTVANNAVNCSPRT